ncbi:MAG: hypothetical protein IKR34_05130 [Candidatus Gastranaerophilales bacterium]|nr:hypothetical protein [Candidatus Gastranaerophilales bacterium]
MKQLISVLIPIIIVIALVLNQMLPADAAKGKKKGVSQEKLDEYTQSVDNLTKKIYRHELYTPEDADSLIALKLQLDEQMDILPEANFAPIYFKIGNIFRLRGEEKDAIICYQTILENFSQTAYGPKSRDILTEMGVEINSFDTALNNSNENSDKKEETKENI